MFDLIATEISGLVELRPVVRSDARGRFVKTVHEPTFLALGLPAHFPEQYYSVSELDVLRGLHFQIPPAACGKLVYCTAGEILDVGVDLRVGSPTYGRHVKRRLSGVEANMIFLPEGLAHGFLVMRGPAVVQYHVTAVYDPQHDTGIRWDSVGIAWPVDAPKVSPRDRELVPFADFDSPFRADR